MPVRDMQFDAAKDRDLALPTGGRRDEQRVTPANESELMLRYTIKRDAKKRKQDKTAAPVRLLQG